jgi:hypothetical protein
MLKESFSVQNPRNIMGRQFLTLVAVCATLLWVGTVHAAKGEIASPGPEAFPATGQTTSYVVQPMTARQPAVPTLTATV